MTSAFPITPPSKHKEAVNLWADEAIWGHRFHNDQTPWLVLMEFLAVFSSRHQQDPAISKALNEERINGEHESIIYKIPRMMPLRELVFNNPYIQQIETTGRADNELWSTWLDEINSDTDFSYLKGRFRKFSHLVRVIEFFQNTSVELHRQRRWTSRFLFPYGANCIYADLPSGINKNPDRRFFARGGELLYLMLSRSGKPELSRKISEILLPENDRWNRMAQVLLPSDYSEKENPVLIDSIGYLPFAERKEYQSLAEDWDTLLGLKLPGATLLDPLMRLSALHMLLYMTRRAHEEIGDDSEPKYVLEIASPNKTPILELSAETLKSNRILSRRAVYAYINQVKEDPEWQKALATPSPIGDIKDYLSKRFSWEPEDGMHGNNPDEILKSLHDYAEKRHSAHVGKVHTEWSRHIGLSVSRRGTGTWYAPDDALLKALVMATVKERKEYHRFLGTLYERYRLVIGVQEAEDAYGTLPMDEKAFTQNVQRLEQRLKTLGLLRRLSDDCAYVENPFKVRL